MNDKKSIENFNQTLKYTLIT